MAKVKFDASLFTATKWVTPADKAKFANHFVRFVESDFKRTLFYDWFYKRLSMTFGHIAHYDIHGFYATWFSNTRSKLNFLNHTATGYGGYGDPAYTYSDVERVLTAWVKDSKKADYYAGKLPAEIETAERAELARLTYKYGSKS